MSTGASGAEHDRPGDRCARLDTRPAVRREHARPSMEDLMIDSSMLEFLISILIAVIIMAGLLIWLS